jgi:hypothetical protein
LHEEEPMALSSLLSVLVTKYAHIYKQHKKIMFASYNVSADYTYMYLLKSLLIFVVTVKFLVAIVKHA